MLSAQEYAAGLQAIAPRMNDAQRRLLVNQYHAPNRTVFATELARLAEIPGGHPAVNAQYGRLGHMFVDATGHEPDFRSDKTPRWWSVFSQGEQHAKGFVWEMLPEVAEALVLLGWVNPTDNEVTMIDKLGHEPGRDASRPRKGSPSFVQEEVFEVIAHVITHASPSVSGFVEHGAIVESFLSNSEGAALVTRARTSASWPDDRSAASNMIAWFSQQITVARSRWVEFFDREQRDGAWAYRPKTVLPSPIAPDPDRAAIEGEPRMFFHVRRERDPELAEAKRQAVLALRKRLECEACGFAVQTTYPDLGGEVCEVHHRRPLADVVERTITRLDDLAVLCANCHRAIHRTKPLLSVEEFTLKFFPHRAQTAG